MSIPTVNFEGLVRWFSEQGVEPDQRLMAALRLASGSIYTTTDRHVLLALCQLNSELVRHLSLDQESEDRLVELIRKASGQGPAIFDNPAERNSMFGKVLRRAINAIPPERDTPTLGTGDFVRALTQQAITTQLADDGDYVPDIVDVLNEVYTGHWHWSVYDHPYVSDTMAHTNRLLSVFAELSSFDEEVEDFQFALGISGNKIVFRPISVLDDYIESKDSGLLVPHRALLTHFKEQFAGFTSDEIEELEELINSTKARESDFQAFFRIHPHFFRKWDHREVHPHVYLTRESDGPLVPDFILTDRELQHSIVVELKLPKPKLIRRQHNRERFADAVMEARAQLLEYRDWFRERTNRERLKTKLGMEIYEPRLAVIIGRSSDFLDSFERQRLRARNPDIEVVTYDDMLTFAKRRRILISSEYPERLL